MNGKYPLKSKNWFTFPKPVQLFKLITFPTTVVIFFVLLSTDGVLAQSPVLAAIEATPLSYNEGQAKTAVTSTVVVSDPDSPTLMSATIQVTNNYSSTEDVLEFANAFSITGSYDPSTGTLTLTGPASITDFNNALRSVTYINTNEDNPSSLVRTISFSVNDGINSSTTVTRDVQVNPLNDLPVGQDDSFVMHEDTELDCGCILVNDTDADGDDLIALHGQLPANGTVNDLGGFFIYTPNPNFYGTDTFTYYANDGTGNSNETTVHITVLPVNDAPIAVNDAITSDEDTDIAIPVLTNDTDIDDVLVGSMIVIVSPSTHGTLTVNSTNGTVDYVPSLNYNGNDSFTYQVKDAAGALSNVATVAIIINPVNDAPVASPDQALTNEEVSVLIPVLANDTDVDNSLDATSLTIVGAPANGTAVIEPATGSILYSPITDFNGNDSFTYQLKDSDGALSAVATVTITVAPINDPPVANPDLATTPEDVAVSIAVLANDADVDNTWTGATIIVLDNPTHGAVVINSATATVMYTPEEDFFGSDSFSYQVKDASGALSNIGLVNVNVTPVNDAPIANPDAANTPEEIPVLVDVLANDIDVDNSLNDAQVILINGPAHGTATVQTGSGKVLYTPEKDFIGDDMFTYSVKDPGGETSVAATVTITVLPVNYPPVAVNDNGTTDENVVVTIDILGNDYDVDNDIIPSSVVVTTSAIHGTVTLEPSGQATYTPHLNFEGNDHFTYTIKDADGLTSLPATVSITVVAAENKVPVATDDGPLQNETLGPIIIDVLANDYDEDDIHKDLVIVSVTNPATGTVSIVDGKLIYTPAGLTSTTITFSYTIRDPSGLTDEATVTIENTFLPLVVSEGFSPNSDNSNDTWYIQGIEHYPDNAVKIFDRWGFVVYQKQRYENNSAPWDGRGNAAQHAGKLLDQGTYYYILEPGHETKTMSGYVVIVR